MSHPTDGPAGPSYPDSPEKLYRHVLELYAAAAGVLASFDSAAAKMADLQQVLPQPAALVQLRQACLNATIVVGTARMLADDALRGPSDPPITH